MEVNRRGKRARDRKEMSIQTEVNVARGRVENMTCERGWQG